MTTASAERRVADRGLNPTITGHLGDPLGVEPETLTESFMCGILGGWRGLGAVSALELTGKPVF
jgi:hypothetical protein